MEGWTVNKKFLVIFLIVILLVGALITFLLIRNSMERTFEKSEGEDLEQASTEDLQEAIEEAIRAELSKTNS